MNGDDRSARPAMRDSASTGPPRRGSVCHDVGTLLGEDVNGVHHTQGFGPDSVKIRVMKMYSASTTVDRERATGRASRRTRYRGRTRGPMARGRPAIVCSCKRQSRHGRQHIRHIAQAVFDAAVRVAQHDVAKFRRHLLERAGRQRLAVDGGEDEHDAESPILEVPGSRASRFVARAHRPGRHVAHAEHSRDRRFSLETRSTRGVSSRWTHRASSAGATLGAAVPEKM